MIEAIDARIDRLYRLLPAVYRARDAGEGLPLRDLLRVIAEQVMVVEDDIARMYDDWFIETCSDWVVPYIAELVGYSAVQGTRAARRDVADYIRNLRRRGTAALLEELAHDSGGFSSRVVELFTLLGWTQNLNHRNARRGQLAELREGEGLELIDSPFDREAHTIDVRNVTAPRHHGLHNIPNAAAYVWRLRAFPLTKTAAYLPQRTSAFLFTFNPLGYDAPLFTSARFEPDPTAIAGEINVPAPIRRRALERHLTDYYPESFAIWLNDSDTPVPPNHLVVADLSKWTYVPKDGTVAVDPQLGRIALPEEPTSVRVSYHYGFSGDIGAHESPRTISQPRDAVLYRVGENEEHPTVKSALDAWKTEKKKKPHAVIEIADSNTYTEDVPAIELGEKESLQIRGAQRTRPVLRILDYGPSRAESLRINMADRSRFTLDGVVLAGRPLRIHGRGKTPPMVRVAVRRSTLVPGWDLDEHCHPAEPEESSLIVENVRGAIAIERSILGTITVKNEVLEADPVTIDVRDSIVDATDDELAAISGSAGYAWAVLRIIRCTVIGEILAHAMELGESSIFTAPLTIVRRQIGCIRFCHVPAGSRTPRRYHCQPDLVEQAVKDAAAPGENTMPRIEEERRRVKPRFTSTSFASPAYCQLDFDCADEIARGAEDEGEMGAFHDLFLPQRVSALRARLDRSTPAGMETGIIFAD
ncbi:MAG: hypothetical protein ACJ74H_14710 [Thermoanaerobaculia bacterium]